MYWVLTQPPYHSEQIDRWIDQVNIRMRKYRLQSLVRLQLARSASSSTLKLSRFSGRHQLTGESLYQMDSPNCETLLRFFDELSETSNSKFEFRLAVQNPFQILKALILPRPFKIMQKSLPEIFRTICLNGVQTKTQSR